MLVLLRLQPFQCLLAANGCMLISFSTSFFQP